MGLLDDYEVNLDEYNANEGFSNPPDGDYEFEIGSVSVKEGSRGDPEWLGVIIQYLLENADGETYDKGEIFGLPKDSHAPTKNERTALGFYKARLLSFGFGESELNNLTQDDLVGIRGVLTLETTKGKNGNDYQNIRSGSLHVDVEEDEPEPEPAKPVKRAARDAAKPFTHLTVPHSSERDVAVANPAKPKRRVTVPVTDPDDEDLFSD